MQRYVVQTHIHGSASEGLGSYTAHDYAAAEAGHVDLIWWMDHEWRLANFMKVTQFGFDEEQEFFTIPNRNMRDEAPTTPIKMRWETISGSDPDGRASISREVVHSGTGSYRLELPSGGTETRTFAQEFKVQVMHERYPLFTHPLVHIAVRIADLVNDEAFPFIRLQLSQQPPDLGPASLLYMLGKSGEVTVVGKEVKIPVPLQGEGWAELTLDPARDVVKLGVPGGLDNSLHLLQIGVTSTGPQVAAYFDSLKIEVQIKGTAALDTLRELLKRTPLRVDSLVGIEISYYGDHTNAFGSNVPIPDYENIPRSEFSNRYIVDHIHKFGGLACYNHPPTANLPVVTDWLVENQVFGFDLMEVAHGKRGLLERLQLLDRIGELGFTMTGIAASDAHGAFEGWGIGGKAPAWVNHIWARSLNEADLLEALVSGRCYVADPAEFQGTLTLGGPGGVTMGDVIETDHFPTLAAHIQGLHRGDMIIWLINGRPAHVGTVQTDEYDEEWQPEAQLHGPAGVRIQVYRPKLATEAYGGIIAASNAVYVTCTPMQTRRQVFHM